MTRLSPEQAPEMDRRARVLLGLRLMAGYAVILAVMLVTGWMMIGSVNHAVSRVGELYVHPSALTNVALETRLLVGQTRHALLMAVLSRAPSDIAAANERIKTLEARLDASLSLIEASELQELDDVAQVRNALPRWSVVRQTILGLMADSRFEEARALALSDGSELFGEVANAMERILTAAHSRTATHELEAKAEERASISRAWTILVGGGLLSLLIGLMVMRNALSTIKRKDHERSTLNAQLEESYALNQAAIAHSAVGIGVYTASGPCVLVNDAYAAIAGGSVEQLLAQDFRSLHSWQKSGMAEAALAALDTGKQTSRDVHLLSTFGRESWVECRFSSFLRNGAPHLLAMIIDITERKMAEAETQMAASVFHNTMEGIIVTATDGTILSVNPGFSRITGYSPDEALGQTPRLLKSDHHDEPFYRNLWQSITQSGVWQGEIWNRRKGGEAYLEWLTITMIPGPDGKPFRYVSVFNDITENRQKDEHIRHLAFHDALTGLPNRLLLQDRLNHAIEIARRDGSQVAVMFIDLDRFKVVNDSLGHDVGDMLLIQVTQRLGQCLRKSDTIARQGGDEFVVLLSDFEAIGEVAEVAEKIIAVLVAPVMVKEQEIHIGASIGIALFPQDGDDVTSLMRDADTAMYRAKNAGRNTFRFFDLNMDGEATERLSLEAGLRRALDNREFQLFYQPKVNLETGKVSGAEALIRWNSPDRGLVPPDSFIPLAEESGLIGRIGDWVLEEACCQLVAWRKEGLVIRVAVNVSGRQFFESDFAAKVASVLAIHNLPASALEVELTESTVMSDPDRAIGQLTRLQALGVTVSIDDFGTGYSSLSYLKRLPLDTIKIDRSFVHHLNDQIDNAAIVRAILGLGEALGMSTIAEGVETAEEERHLQNAGCAVGQGFKYARPLPASDFMDWVKKHEWGGL